MAKMIGEDVFPGVVHEGERESIYISVIGRSLLVLVFDERSTLGLVKIRTKRASYEVAGILEEVAVESADYMPTDIPVQVTLSALRRFSIRTRVSLSDRPR